MSRCLRFLGIVFLLVSAGACEDISGPWGFDLPDEDLSLDPAHLSVGYEVYYCGDWNRTAGKPIASELFADVFFYGSDPPLDHPLAIHRSIIQSAGAVVVRTYHGPGFRVWIKRDSIPSLYERHGISFRSVPDLRRYDLRVYVAYKAPAVFGTADSLRVVALGGQILKNFEALGLVLMHIPERSVAQLWTDPKVSWVSSGPDFLCSF